MGCRLDSRSGQGVAMRRRDVYCTDDVLHCGRAEDYQTRIWVADLSASLSARPRGCSRSVAAASEQAIRGPSSITARTHARPAAHACAGMGARFPRAR